MQRKIIWIALAVAIVSLLCSFMALYSRSSLPVQNPSTAVQPVANLQNNGIPQTSAEKPIFQGDYPRISPFIAVGWDGDTPMVMTIATQGWYDLISMDGIDASDIISMCKSFDKIYWRKRFEEDLVEVLTRSGHKPGNSTTLSLKSTNTKDVITLKDVAMTEANRQATMLLREEHDKIGSAPTSQK